MKDEVLAVGILAANESIPEGNPELVRIPRLWSRLDD